MCNNQGTSGCNMTRIHCPNNYSHSKVRRQLHVITSNTTTTHIVHIICIPIQPAASQQSVKWSSRVCGTIVALYAATTVKWSPLICNWIFFCLCTWNVVLVLTTVKSCYRFCFWPRTHAQVSMYELLRYQGAKSMISFSTILCISDALLHAIGA